MDMVVKRNDLPPEVRQALERASTAWSVRIVPVQGGFRLVTLGKTATRGYRRQGPVRLGHKNHLGLKLED